MTEMPNQLNLPIFKFGEWFFNLLHLGGYKFNENGSVSVIISGAQIVLKGDEAIAFQDFIEQATGQKLVTPAYPHGL